MQNITGSGKRTPLTGGRRGKSHSLLDLNNAPLVGESLMKENRRALLLTTLLLRVWERRTLNQAQYMQDPCQMPLQQFCQIIKSTSPGSPFTQGTPLRRYLFQSPGQHSLFLYSCMCLKAPPCGAPSFSNYRCLPHYNHDISQEQLNFLTLQFTYCNLQRADSHPLLTPCDSYCTSASQSFAISTVPAAFLHKRLQ